MKTHRKLVMAAGIGFFGLGAAALPASAMPLSGLDPALATAADRTERFQDCPLDLRLLRGLPTGPWLAAPRMAETPQWMGSRLHMGSPFKMGWRLRMGTRLRHLGLGRPVGSKILLVIRGAFRSARLAQVLSHILFYAGKVSRSAQTKTRPRCVPCTGVTSLFCRLEIGRPTHRFFANHPMAEAQKPLPKFARTTAKNSATTIQRKMSTGLSDRTARFRRGAEDVPVTSHRKCDCIWQRQSL